MVNTINHVINCLISVTKIPTDIPLSFSPIYFAVKTGTFEFPNRYVNVKLIANL